ncbi:MAG: histidine--tRNA ligase [Candidatus Paceibacterota bacterium]
MSDLPKIKLSTDSYKGVRDFFPEDQFIQNYLLNTIRKTVEAFGYDEYNASPLEPTELYASKTSDEIVNEQTYTFTDRGGRSVTLRPEMTPTVSRMVSSKIRELGLPIRWYSIPNVFRYEQPQKGRLREHYQLNVDLFGVSSIQGEIEIINMASSVMHAFGLEDNDFEIRINSRKIVNAILLDICKLEGEATKTVVRLIDKKEKLSKADFETKLSEILGEKAPLINTLLSSQNFDEFISHLPEGMKAAEGISEIKVVLEKLEKLGITNAVFNQSLMRGFDYYTGIVFEVFDKSPENRRALFGGGRFDGLLSLFGAPQTPAVGFGMGDVTLRDALESRKLLPKYTGHTTLHICLPDMKYIDDAEELAQIIREDGTAVTVDYSEKKIGDQIKYAEKRLTRYIVCVGENELKYDTYKIKELKTGKETELAREEIPAFLKN